MRKGHSRTMILDHGGCMELFVPNLKYVGACVLGELALRSASLFRVGPGYAGAGFGDQRYAEVYDVFHDVADHGG